MCRHLLVVNVYNMSILYDGSHILAIPLVIYVAI